MSRLLCLLHHCFPFTPSSPFISCGMDKHAVYLFVASKAALAYYGSSNVCSVAFIKGLGIINKEMIDYLTAN